MLFFPLLYPCNREKKIRILRGLAAAVQDAGRTDEALRRNRVGGVVRQILSRHPVDRRVEMRAGVLAAGKIVPVPGGAALVVARHFLDAERPGLAHLRRERDLRELWRKRLREVDHPDSSCRQFANEIIENAHEDNSLSSAFGLSRQRASHSCATSPGYRSSTPSRRAPTMASASPAAWTLGGGRSWFHSSSIGPGKTLTTRTPAGRISARRHCASECAAAFEAENVPCGGKLASA